MPHRVPLNEPKFYALACVLAWSTACGGVSTPSSQADPSIADPKSAYDSNSGAAGASASTAAGSAGAIAAAPLKPDTPPQELPGKDVPPKELPPKELPPNDGPPNTPPKDTLPEDPPLTDLDATSYVNSYPGTGFVVHEWGTNTVVVGSDGSLQRGLHHEEDDLPGFVYDRMKEGNLLGFPSVDKMETPVDYFYSEHALEAKVRVDLPEGVLTQWYPAVSQFAPAVLIDMRGRLVDPLSELDYPYESPLCSSKYSGVFGGKLDWGTVSVLAPDAQVEAELPAAPLDRFAWSYAREVKANAIRVNNPSSRAADQSVLSGPQTEKFLFYRGIGNFAAPLTVSATSLESKSIAKLGNFGKASAGAVFVLNVSADSGAFTVQRGGVPAGTTLEAPVPSLSEGMPIDTFVAKLATAMAQSLIAEGLYTDEAIGMVKTWRRQWFRTPGVRVLYFAPESWIDTHVPLSIEPQPKTVKRVMVMRVELLTPEIETEDREFAAMLDRSSLDFTMAMSYFAGLGRFAEPRLRRALTLLGTTGPQAQKLLVDLEAPNASFTMGE